MTWKKWNNIDNFRKMLWLRKPQKDWDNWPNFLTTFGFRWMGSPRIVRGWKFEARWKGSLFLHVFVTIIACICQRNLDKGAWPRKISKPEFYSSSPTRRSRYKLPQQSNLSVILNCVTKGRVQMWHDYTPDDKVIMSFKFITRLSGSAIMSS